MMQESSNNVIAIYRSQSNEQLMTSKSAITSRELFVLFFFRKCLTAGPPGNSQYLFFNNSKSKGTKL